MKNNNNKNNLSRYAVTLLSLVVLFLISFSTSAWIYIKSNNLVFTDTIEEYEEKYKKISETEEKIEELEEQLERYKSMYEGAIKENKLLSSSVSAVVDNSEKEKKNYESEKDNSSEEKEEIHKKTDETDVENAEEKEGNTSVKKDEEKDEEE